MAESLKLQETVTCWKTSKELKNTYLQVDAIGSHDVVGIEEA